MNMTLLLDPDWWFYSRIHSNTVYAHTFITYIGAYACGTYTRTYTRIQANTYPLLTAFLSIIITCVYRVSAESIDIKAQIYTCVCSPGLCHAMPCYMEQNSNVS